MLHARQYTCIYVCAARLDTLDECLGADEDGLSCIPTFYSSTELEALVFLLPPPLDKGLSELALDTFSIIPYKNSPSSAFGHLTWPAAGLLSVHDASSQTPGLYNKQILRDAGHLFPIAGLTCGPCQPIHLPITAKPEACDPDRPGWPASGPHQHSDHHADIRHNAYTANTANTPGILRAKEDRSA